MQAVLRDSRSRWPRTRRSWARRCPLRCLSAEQGAAARLRARPAARHLHPGAERGRPGAGRHARRARAHRDGAAEAQPRRRRRVQRQALLVPAVLSAEALDIATAEENRETLERLGLEMAVSGPNELTVRAAPALLASGDIVGAGARRAARDPRVRREPRCSPRAPERAARHHGLPCRGARQPDADASPR